MIYDVAILGAGPAGLTAGVYCARKKLKTLVISKDIGGQAALSSDIENYLGFTMIAGADLAEKFLDHLEEYDVDLKQAYEVSEIKKEKAGFKIVANDKEFEAKTVIITSGKTARMLGVPGEKEFKNKGVTYCATCDAPLFKGKDVAVVGGGNSALDAAHQLTKFANKIYVINTNADYSATEQVLLDKVKKEKNTELLVKKETVEVLGDKLVTGIKIKDKETNKEETLEVQGIFIEIGSVPSTDYLKGFLDLNERGEIVIDKTNATSVPGVFAAGDVTDVLEKQIIVAAGEGCKAALMASKYLVQNH